MHAISDELTKREVLVITLFIEVFITDPLLPSGLRVNYTTPCKRKDLSSGV